MTGWRCPECGTLNAEGREWCKRCSEPRPRTLADAHFAAVERELERDGQAGSADPEDGKENIAG